MSTWDMSAVQADFFEVVPENWLRRDRAPLHRLLASGRSIALHGVSLNLGGDSALDPGFLRAIHALMQELGSCHYSDHLAASGDAHQLYDLFPIPFTQAEVRRVADRIRHAQDILGQAMGVENSTWYTNVGEMCEAQFLAEVADRADCAIVLDLNNIDVNHKNHGGHDIEGYVSHIDLSRVSYLHVAGHEFDPRFGMYVDTHSRGVSASTAQWALRLHEHHGLPILLEWDNDIPGVQEINRELECLQRFMTTSEV
ncbi:DUF692 domain-containing protein [Bordetella holmesii]|nr:DUF692 domain-containing protein [Bordetella holmesii]EWM43786.1 hypothetical protein D556_1248 [Bordetella holmesii 41130]AUL21060.1 hypothetical protein BTL46_17495 [Bordetella holmesii]AUL24397.1 hypothetical protein BTL48_17515 [Bordetella holmesii]AUL27726.1 hypothetical protein BTL49_17590 [Bordetella holmesii]AUL31070.1 hypothetical protein BTL50_17585 [Bordetella holmesii]